MPKARPFIIVARIIDAVEIGKQRAKQGTAFQELMPVLGGASQSRHVHPEHQADVIQSHLGHQTWKALAAFHAGSGLTEVVIDHQDPFFRPTQGHSTMHQAVWQLGGGLVIEHLLHG